MSAPDSTAIWSTSLSRLDAVRNTEGEAGKSLQGTRDMNFRDIIQAWWRIHKDDIAPNLPAEQEDDLWAILIAIAREHRLTNPVRHHFARLASKEAQGSNPAALLVSL